VEQKPGTEEWPNDFGSDEWAIANSEWVVVNSQGRNRDFWERVFKAWRDGAHEFSYAGDQFFVFKAEDDDFYAMATFSHIRLYGRVKFVQGGFGHALYVSKPLDYPVWPVSDSRRPASDKSEGVSDF